MNTEDILTLLKAGFTREEILALEKPAEPAGGPAPRDEPEPAPEPEPEETPEPEENNGNDEILAAINKLTGQFNVLLNRSIGRETPDEEQTVDDILKNVFYPDPSGGGKK